MLKIPDFTIRALTQLHLSDRKRSQYRIPTALGVPNSQLSNQKMYSPATVEAFAPTKVPPPPDNLAPKEGTMSQYKTETQKRYKAYDVQPPQKVKMADNLPIIDDGSNSFETNR
jgi:hypothetical protein